MYRKVEPDFMALTFYGNDEESRIIDTLEDVNLKILTTNHKIVFIF